MAQRPCQHGWRETTIDVDIRLVPESESALLAIPRLKDELRINVELASSADFIPVLPGWNERGPFVVREERLTFYHFELVAQALAKLERCPHPGPRHLAESKTASSRVSQVPT